MSGSLSSSKVIEAASDLKFALEELFSAYKDLLKIIDAEHAAISRSDLQVIEELVIHKEKVSFAIEGAIQKIRNIGKGLSTYFLDDNSAPASQTTTINQVLELIKRAAKDVIVNLIEKDAVDKILQKSHDVFSQFIDLRCITEPKIEMNRYLTERLLFHHQKSYEFWQEVAQQSTSTYQDDGKQKQKVVAPLLRVKA